MIEECAERLESDSVLELVEQMRALHARNKETEAHRPPPPAPPPSGLSHVSLAVKGGAPTDTPLSASGGDAQRVPTPSPPKEKERLRLEHPRKEDPNAVRT